MPLSRSPEWRPRTNEQLRSSKEVRPNVETPNRYNALAQAMREFRWSVIVPDAGDREYDPSRWNLMKVLSYRNLHFIPSRIDDQIKVISVQNGVAVPVTTVNSDLMDIARRYFNAMDQKAKVRAHEMQRAYSAPSDSLRQTTPEARVPKEFRFSIVRDQDNVRILRSADGRYLFGPVNGVVTVYRLDADGGYAPAHPLDQIARADVRAEILRRGSELGWNLKKEASSMQTASVSPSEQKQVRQPAKEVAPLQSAPEFRLQQKQAREQVTESRSGSSAETLFRDVQSLSIMIAGERVSVSINGEPASPQQLESYLRKRGVTPARYEVCGSALRQHLVNAEHALRDTQSGPWKVLFRGNHFELQSKDARLITTMTSVLRFKDANHATTLAGESVSVHERPTTVEYRFGSKRELYRMDGTLQYRQEGDRKEYFDGSLTPIMERTNDTSYIVGAGGQRIDVARPVTKQSVDAYASEVTSSLRSPEAIGAFVSQFWLSKEFKGATPENAEWLSQIQRPGANPVNFTLEKNGKQDVQHWRRTLMLRSGDCEDFALLAKEFLRRIGIESFAMRVKQDHFQTIFFEKAGVENGRQRYAVCSVGLYGFHRSSETFPDLASATKSLWQGGERKDLKDLLPSPVEVSDPATKQMIADVLKHGGAEAYLDQPKNEADGTNERTSVIPYGGQYAEAMFAPYVR